MHPKSDVRRGHSDEHKATVVAGATMHDLLESPLLPSIGSLKNFLRDVHCDE